MSFEMNFKLNFILVAALYAFACSYLPAQEPKPEVLPVDKAETAGEDQKSNEIKLPVYEQSLAVPVEINGVKGCLLVTDTAETILCDSVAKQLDVKLKPYMGKAVGASAIH